MRLALVTPWPPLRGGIAQHSVAMAKAAGERGHEIEVVSYRKLYPPWLFPGTSEIDQDAIPPLGVAVRAVLEGARPFTWISAGRSLAATRPDVVLLQRWHPYFAPALAITAHAARLGGSAVVWLFHNVRPHEGKWLPWGPLLTLGVGPTDLCLTHSLAVATELSRRDTRARVVQVPMPAHPLPSRPIERGVARARLALPAESRLFLVFGHVRAYKGLDVLVSALRMLAVDGPAWQVLVVGEWYRGAAELRTELAGLGDRVRIIDRYVPAGEVAEWFGAADVVIAAHRAATQSGCVPLALAHERPVIVSDAGGIAEGVTDGESGLVVPAGDAVALAAAMRRVLAGHAFSAAAIRAENERRSWAPLLDELEALPSRRVHSAADDGASRPGPMS